MWKYISLGIYISRSSGIYIKYISLGIYIYIYIHIYPSNGGYIRQYIPQMGDISDSIFMKKLSPLNGIYIVYTVLSRGICNNIPPQPRHFFVLGLRPRTKKCLGFGDILFHTPRKHRIYITYIYIYKTIVYD